VNKAKNIFLLLIVAAFNMRGQSNQVVRAQAFEAMQNKDWYNASRFYKRLYLHDSTNKKVKYDYAEASFRDGNIDQALRLFSGLAATDNGRKYPLAFYFLGESLRYKGKYKEAQQWYVKFNKLQLKKEKYRYYKRKSKVNIEACDLARVLVNNPVDAEVSHMNAPLNTIFSEYAPAEYDSVVYFSSLRQLSKAGANDPGKIYKLAGRNRAKAVPLDTTINSAVTHNANALILPGKKQMIFSRCVSLNASDYNCRLFVSSFDRKRWQPAIPLDSLNVDGFSTSQPATGRVNGRDALFFSSNRPGGFGGMDIWYVFQKDSGFDKPVNAGNLVNSADDEITPWFDVKNNALYFSSTWHAGLGGFDIFKSDVREGVFAVPVNAGYPVNSSYNDTYYWSDSTGVVYLSSNRPGSMFEGSPNCCSDIYSFKTNVSKAPVPIDSVKITREKMRLLVPLTLYFHNDQPDPATRSTTTTVNYRESYEEYKKLKSRYIDEFSKGMNDRKSAASEVDIFFRDSVDAGIENLERFAELLTKSLNNGETVKITMKGYCSPLATTDYNVNLAKRRISSLRNYFSKWRDGYFKKYIGDTKSNGGKIIFEDVDIGELPASRASDNLKDKRNSVYSPQAASERKIQIIAVSFVNE
jgi:tetratricopeptide (TPR) repeat protein